MKKFLFCIVFLSFFVLQAAIAKDETENLVIGANIGPAPMVAATKPVDFSNMKHLWCTVDYKHWAAAYANQIDYKELSFYLYLDEENGKVYDQYKKEMAQTLQYNDKEIKFVNKFHQDKRTFTETYTLDRYTGRAKGEGTIRHDYGGWASITYENRDFLANGQCAMKDEKRKF